MSEYCNNRLSERFKNKIPQFLARLSIWNEDTMDDCAATPRAYHKALKQQQKKHAVCVICGKVFEKGKYQKTRTTCSRSCGCKLWTFTYRSQLDLSQIALKKYRWA